MRTRWILLISLLSLALGSCGGPSQAMTEQSPAHTPPGLTNQPANTETSQMDNFLDNTDVTPPPSVSDQFVNLAKQDLAGRLKISTNQIISLKVTEITWPDITQGCSSTSNQTLSKGRVSGYRIWLQANGENFSYHVGLDGQVFMCLK